jgi:phytoene dehydrogenase-like protein
VAQVIVKQGQVAGVALANGDELTAPVVASSLTPQNNFLRLLDPAQLPADLVTQAQQWQSQGCSGKVNLSLAGLPRFACMPQPGPHLAGGFSIAPRLITLNGPMMRRNTAVSPLTPSSTCSSLLPLTPTWLRPAGT